MNKLAIMTVAMFLAACSGAPEEGTPDEPVDAVAEPLTQPEAEKLWIEAGGDPVSPAPVAPSVSEEASAEEKRLERKANAEDRANSVK
jgi:PBP1b-binding outer membrane lipoprotein LpoB